jgi:hypothetical protein
MALMVRTCMVALYPAFALVSRRPWWIMIGQHHPNG